MCKLDLVAPLGPEYISGAQCVGYVLGIWRASPYARARIFIASLVGPVVFLGLIRASCAAYHSSQLLCFEYLPQCSGRL